MDMGFNKELIYCVWNMNVLNIFKNKSLFGYSTENE